MSAVSREKTKMIHNIYKIDELLLSFPIRFEMKPSYIKHGKRVHKPENQVYFEILCEFILLYGLLLPLLIRSRMCEPKETPS